VLRSSGNVELDASQPATTVGSRVIEVTQGPTPDLVWQLDISVPNAYRSYRIASLYRECSGRTTLIENRASKERAQSFHAGAFRYP
jgi:hypothetical protein